MVIITKMSAYIFIHHEGQFLHLNAHPKIQATLGRKEYVNVIHALTYSLETFSDEGKKQCDTTLNHKLDACLIQV